MQHDHLSLVSLSQLPGPTPAHHNPHTPPPPPAVGYRVFLGNGRYFVSSDVGGGKMQWYGFHKEPAGGTGERWGAGGTGRGMCRGLVALRWP